MSFDQLGLQPAFLRAVAEQGYTEPTPIQHQAIPLVLAGRDLMAGAQTGTGKTAAFLITTFSRLLKHPERKQGPRALIVAPTRELVVQILHDAQALGEFTGLTFHAVYGGVDYAKQRESLRAGTIKGRRTNVRRERANLKPRR